jgi:glycosyltransferase involved in cell wall biosynthesis
MAARTIAFLTPLYFDEGSCLGGGERYPLNLARALVASAGPPIRVDLLSFGARSARRTLAEGVTLRVLPVAGRPENPLDVVSWELPEALAPADLVHIHQPFTRCGEVGLLVAKQQRKPVCVTDHGGASSRLADELDLLALVDRVVAYSDFGASLYRTSRPIDVIKGGVDDRFFTPASTPARRDRILYAGRLLPHKGVDRLIEALPAGVPLTVCGRPYHQEYARRLRELAASKDVTFLADADDAALRDLYRRSWATVLPSVYLDCYGTTHRMPELMGLTLLESMACGTPAIAARVGGMPEFVEHGLTGFVFDGVGELSAQLASLAGDDALADRLGRAAREAIVTRHGLTAVGARLRALYDSLVATARGAAA